MSGSDFDPREFLADYLTEAGEHLATLEGALLEAERAAAGGAAPGAALINETFRAIHSLKGMAGMMGFQATTRLAHEIEQLLDEARQGARTMAAAEYGSIFAALDAFKRLHECIAATGCESGEDVGAEVAAINAILRRGAGPVPPVDLYPSLDPHDQMAVLVAAAKGAAVYEIRPPAPRAGWVVDLADVVEVFGAVDAAGVPCALEVASRAAVALVATGHDAASLAEVLGIPLAALRAPALPGVPNPGAARLDGGRQALPAAEQREDTSGATAELAGTDAMPAVERAQSVRVETARLDILMELVGELVIHHTRFAQLSANLAGFVEASGSLDERAEQLTELARGFEEAMQAVGRVSDELQQGTMRVRMVPVKTLFNRFPRIVRDLARDCGKAARLDLEGADTELDKTVVEQIGDPIVHLLRNAVDHGLEPAEHRAMTGKPPEGVVTLSARQQGHHIVIVVADDGRGIDRARVLAKARALGLVGPDEAPADQEVLQLIFRPGFSTAEAVTNISGRGVGMDVVHQNIRKLGGQVLVESEPGRGTRFVVKLPLTLAIAKALLVRAGGATYAIPLAVVEETIRVRPDDLRTVAEREVIEVRGSVLPVFRLADLFGSEPEPATGTHRAVIIVADGRHRMGLVVDALVGQQDVVVKALGDYLGQVRGVGGATVLGDGRVALIIDAATLLERPAGVAQAAPMLR